MKKVMRKKTAIYSAIAAATLATTTSWAANVPAGTQLAPAKDQVLTIANGSEPQAIDPQLVQGVPGAIIDRDLFEGLTVENAKGNPVPGVATSWDMSKDGKTYTFHLRKNAKWSDGTPVTAQDFVYGWQRAVNPETNSQYAWFLSTAHIENAQAIIDSKKPVTSLGVKAINPTTFQVTLTEKTPYFLEMLVNNVMDPAPEKVIKKYGKAWTAPRHIISNGAYKLQSRVVNSHITLVRNTDYWNNKNTVINKITYLPIQGDNAINQYKSNEIQILNPETGISTVNYQAFEKSNPQDVKEAPMLGTYYYDFNVHNPELKDPHVRRALSEAIDRTTLTKYVTAMGEVPAYSFLPPSISNYKAPNIPATKKTQAQRNADAKKLLKAAGYGPSHPLKITIAYNTNKMHKKIALAISQMWQAIGVNATIENQEWKTFLTTRQEGQYQVARDGWNADYNDPSDFLDLFTTGNTQNNPHWSNKQYDLLIKTADNLTDPKQRASLYQEAQNVMIHDAPIAPLYYYVAVSLVKPGIKGYVTTRPDAATYGREMYIVKQPS